MSALAELLVGHPFRILAIAAAFGVAAWLLRRAALWVPAAALLLPALAAPALAAEAIEELPIAYRCSGTEPFWGIRIEGPKATYTALGEEPVELSGTFRTLDYAGLFVFRGAPAKGDDWVAFVLHETCEDTMAEAGERGGRMPFSIGLSLPGGDARIGCCRPLEASTPSPDLRP